MRDVCERTQQNPGLLDKPLQRHSGSVNFVSLLALKRADPGPSPPLYDVYEL